MLCVSDLERLREAYGAYSGLTLHDALGRIGHPSNETIVAFAAEMMSHSDRNVRVLALRVLAHQCGDTAMRGVLAGLQDEKRRVRAVAIQSCPNFLGYEEIVDRLEAIARDSGLKRKLRRRALSMLAGNEGRLQGDLTQAAADALWRLLADAEYRFAIAFGLVRLDPTPRVKSLLEAFSRSTDKLERRMAERALRGERVIHIDGFSTDEATMRRILASCDIAHGRMYYWIPRVGMESPSPAPPRGGA